MGVGLAGLILLATLGFEWKSVKPTKKKDEVENGEAGSVEGQIKAEKEKDINGAKA